MNLHTNAKICICACSYVIPAIFGVLDYCNYYAKRKYLHAYMVKRARPCLFSLLLYIELGTFYLLHLRVAIIKMVAQRHVAAVPRSGVRTYLHLVCQ